jgi:hypothetical protein
MGASRSVERYAAWSAARYFLLLSRLPKGRGARDVCAVWITRGENPLPSAGRQRPPAMFLSSNVPK